MEALNADVGILRASLSQKKKSSCLQTILACNRSFKSAWREARRPHPAFEKNEKQKEPELNPGKGIVFIADLNFTQNR